MTLKINITIEITASVDNTDSDALKVGRELAALAGRRDEFSPEQLERIGANWVTQLASLLGRASGLASPKAVVGINRRANGGRDS